MAPAGRAGTRPPAAAAHSAPLSGHLLLSVRLPPLHPTPQPQDEQGGGEPGNPGVPPPAPQHPPRPAQALPAGAPTLLRVPSGAPGTPQEGGLEAVPGWWGGACGVQPRPLDSTRPRAQLRRAHLVRSPWGGWGAHFSTVLSPLWSQSLPQRPWWLTPHSLLLRYRSQGPFYSSETCQGRVPLSTQDLGFSSP